MTIIYMGLFIFALIALQGYLFKKFWDRGLTVNIKFSAKEAFEGEQIYLTQDITNRKFLPLPWLFLSFHMSRNLIFLDEDTSADIPTKSKHDSDGKSQNELFSVMMFQSVRRRVAFVCSRRGIYRFKRVTLTATNLMHSKQFSKDFRSVNRLVVFPKIIDASELEVLYKRMDAELLSHQLINPDPFEFRGIREYQPTDPAHTVNFKATAIAQQLMVNIHAPISSKRLHVILNLESYTTYPDRELFEHSIRLAASVAGHYINDNVNVAFTTNGQDLDLATRGGGGLVNLRGGASTSHLYAIYEALARIDLTFKVTPMSEYINSIMDYEAVYLIISAYHKNDLLDSFEGLRDRGGSGFMVIPYNSETGIGIDNNLLETEHISTLEVIV
ncbi:MAG: DUF58 domain-containing protein [Defluviitaleaceae bacterium]|nr:DUF58 domain-containing protein [Defluviitaleaceae bacterium]